MSPTTYGEVGETRVVRLTRIAFLSQRHLVAIKTARTAAHYGAAHGSSFPSRSAGWPSVCLRLVIEARHVLKGEGREASVESLAFRRVGNRISCSARTSNARRRVHSPPATVQFLANQILAPTGPIRRTSASFHILGGSYLHILNSYCRLPTTA